MDIDYYYDEFNMILFLYIKDFSEYIYQNYLNKNFYFYEVYIKYYCYKIHTIMILFQ